ncbi:15798_t:CDS:2, partial [Acaulospora colombiana]
IFAGTILDLDLPYDIMECSTIILLPSFTLRLRLRCDGVMANSFFSKSLQSLSISQPHRRNTASDDYLPLDIDLNHWPAIQRISLYGRPVVWSKFSLAFLRYVGIFGEAALEEIELGECPELDILVIMLERRNLLQGSSIKKIEKISFQSSCSLSVRKIISSLLKGKWAERPSNKDLSLAGNAEILLDLNLPGCYMCHRGLRFCNIVVENASKTDNIQDSIEALKVYPNEEDEILSSWTDRALLWEGIDRNTAGRLLRCSWSVGTFKSITADSF